jgi:thiol-disulfide isomerase/thioredoxin
MNIVAYHFWSPTCNPCKVIKPAVENLKEEFEQVNWISVNTHDDPNNFSQKFGVSVVPTIVVTVMNKDEKIIYSQKHSGTDMIAYYRIIRNALKFI